MLESDAVGRRVQITARGAVRTVWAKLRTIPSASPRLPVRRCPQPSVHPAVTRHDPAPLAQPDGLTYLRRSLGTPADLCNGHRVTCRAVRAMRSPGPLPAPAAGLRHASARTV